MKTKTIVMKNKYKTKLSGGNYLKEFMRVMSGACATDSSFRFINFAQAIEEMISEILKRKNKGGRVILIGNGGSASIASHIATDLLKNAGIPALSFNDSSLLTCVSNDLGYEYVFQLPIGLLSDRKDILFSISSSGESKNIINATQEAKRKGCFVATLTGFNKQNALRKLGDINFYVPSGSYGYVEISHLLICHCIADKIIQYKNQMSAAQTKRRKR